MAVAPDLTRTRPGGAPPAAGAPAAPQAQAFQQAAPQAGQPTQAGQPRQQAPASNAPAQAAPSSVPPPAPKPGQVPIPPERAAAIRTWVDTRSDPHNDGFLHLRHHGTAAKLTDALAGRTELGPLTPDEQRHLTDAVLDRWAAGKGEGANGPGSLVRELPPDPATRGIVGERIALRAGALAARPLPDDGIARYQSRTETSLYAQAAVEAVSGPVGRPPGDVTPLRDMVGRLGPDGAAGLAQALDPNPDGLSPPGSMPSGYGGPAEANAELLGRTVAALNGGPRTDAGGAFVQNAFATATPQAYTLSLSPQAGSMEPRGRQGVPDMRTEMATALAREWNPDNPQAAQAEGQRLGAILQTSQGMDLLAARPNGPGLDARVNALATLRLHPEITADTLRQPSDAWTNPAITGPAAQANALPFLQRGDAPVPLRGSDLDNTVGGVMGQRPQVPPGMTPEQAEAAMARGEASLFAANPAVRAVSDRIREIGGPDARVAVLPVTYSSGQTGPVRIPLFRVGTPAGERFVDNQGAVYRDFEHWRTTNKLPPGNMQYPEGGHLAAGPDGQVRLGQGNTPRTPDTWQERAGQVLDAAALVGGVVATGLVIAGTGGTAALVLGAGAAAWNATRTVEALHDRADHGQSISLADPAARGLWLNLAADTAAVGAFGSAARLAQVGRSGAAIAPLEASAHGYTQAAAMATGTVATANAGVDLAANWNQMPGEARLGAVLQIGLFGATTMAGMRATGAKPGDMFNPVAIRDSLLQAYAPPVRPDPALRGNAVRIVADRTGAVQEIRTGPLATQADIALHQRHAQLAQRTGALEERLGSLMRGEPQPGSEGWAARLDLAKMREVNAARAQELNSPGLTPERRAQVEGELADGDRYMAELAQRVGSYERPRDGVAIDAPASRPSAQERLAQLKRVRDTANRERALEARMNEAGAQDKYRGLDPADHAWIEADPARRRALAFDPARGGWKANEARAALEAEAQGVLDGPVTRAASVEGREIGSDYFDRNGVEWDHINGASDPAEGVASILAKAGPKNGQTGENVLVDCLGLTEAQQRALQQAVGALPPDPGRGRIVFVGRT